MDDEADECEGAASIGMPDESRVDASDEGPIPFN